MLPRRRFLGRAAAFWIGAAATGSLHGGGARPAVADSGHEQPGPPSPPRHLEILRLDAPEWIEVGVPFSVHIVAADDRGLAAVELDFGDQRFRLDALGQKKAHLSVELEARDARPTRLRAVAVGLDGTRGERKTTVIAVALSDVRPGIGQSENFRRRLADLRYARQNGSASHAHDPLDEKNPFAPGKTKPIMALDPWWIRWRADGGGHPFDFKTACGNWIAEIGPFGEVLTCWLELHPEVAQSLVWVDLDPETGFQTDTAYPDWTDVQKIQLDQAFFWAWEWLHDGLAFFNGEYLVDPPDNQIPLVDCAGVATGLTHDAAWKLYLGTVAHSLALEIGGFVPWSVVGYAQEELNTLFHSQWMFFVGTLEMGTDSCPGSKLSFKGHSVNGYVIPAPPTTTFQFLVTQNIVQADHYRSIAALLAWARLHMLHIAGGHDTKNMEAFYGYRGDAPASRIMTGTTYVDPDLGFTLGPAGFSPVGCHGVAYFFRATMRAANIPVQYFPICGHAVPMFWTVGHTLTHGDDVYNKWSKVTPPFPADYLLISTFMFDVLFFGVPGSPEDCNHIGRRPTDIALKEIPNELVELYCDDVSHGLSHAASAVYDLFHTWYTLAALEAQGLWTTLAAKAAKLGLC